MNPLRPASAPAARIFVASLLATSLWLVSPAGAAPNPDAGRIPARLISPAPGERVVESAARFAFELPRGLTDAKLVISRRAFDPRGWTEIPTDQEFVVTAASNAAASLAQAGIAIDADATLWWAVAARDPRTGALRVSDVRSFTALRKFANRVAPSPYLMPGTRGRMADAGVDARVAPSGNTVGGAPRLPHLRLTAGYDFSLGEPVRPAVPAKLSISSAPRDENASALRSVLVQFPETPSSEDLAAITGAGGAVFSYIPDQAYLVRMTDAARARLEAGPRAVWVGDYEPAYKLSPQIDVSAAGRTSFTALLFPDASVAETRATLTGMGASDVVTSDNGVNRIVRFTLDHGMVPAAVGMSGLAWLEPSPRFELYNANVQWNVMTGVLNNRRVWDMGIRGQGQVVSTTDSGINTDHNQFVDPLVPITTFGDYPTHRKVIGYKNGSLNPGITFGDHAGASYHGTHTAGTIAGSDDPISTSLYDGVAKDAKIYFLDISGTSLANGVDPFPDLNDDFLPAYIGNAGGAARVSSHSWGSAASGAYTLNSMQVDQFMWAHPDFFISFSNGNSGGAYTVGSPATAKNSVGAGGSRNGTTAGIINSIYVSTSRGPTADGRRKPTWCTPGQTVTSANGGTTNGYQTLSGTSMASPGGAGAIALVRQYLTDGWYPTGAPVPANGFSPSAALLKAMGINSADNTITSYTAPDNNIGWGRLTIDNVLYFAGDSTKLMVVDNTEGLQHGDYIEYQLNVVDASRPLEVTLCWTDYPGNPAAAVQLVNNLNLTVSKGASVWKGNVYSGGASVTGGVYDSLNVEENIRILAPGTGLFTIRVDAPNVPIGPQPFALCITGGVGNGAGALALDRATYGSADTLEVQVIDTNAVPPVTVSVASGTESTPETLTLSGGNGIYTGTLALSSALATNGDNLLSVSNGDLINATYNDASPVATLNASAGVTFDTPTITNVKATAMSATSTLITWDTDRNATSRVWWGPTGALENGAADSAGYALHHAVLLNGLTSGATYSYDVESMTLQNGGARDDLGGAHHKFTVKRPGDVLLVIGDAASPRTDRWQNALNLLGFDTDIWLGGEQVANPLVGDLNSGMRSYRAVLWQVHPDEYPPVTDTQRAAIDALINGGGRFAITGHDIGWGLVDPASPGYTPARAAWFQSGLKATYISDPPSWPANLGIAGDPISGAYTGGVTYEPIGSGQSGDGIGLAPASGGTGAFVWKNNLTPADNIAIRWESSTPNGDAGSATWGGLPSRLVLMCFEWSLTGNEPIRADILDKTILYLMGRNRPTVTLTALDGGNVVTADAVDISWNESVAGGYNVGARTIQYSLDNGDSWVTLTTSAGASPYSWDLTSVPNSALARVRVLVSDDGAPTLSGSDRSAAAFTIDRASGDAQGPVVVAGSIACSPNPIVRPNPATLSARITEQFTGAGVVAAAEWSLGDTPAPAGTGTAMSGTFGTATVDVTVALDTAPFFTGNRTLWVRGQDSSGQWGAAASLVVKVNGTDPVGVGDLPAISFLAPSAPNPFAGATAIRYGLAKPGKVELGVFDAQGRRVKTLVSESMPAGTHLASWNGSDANGVHAKPGVYYVRLKTPAGEFQKRTVMLQ